MKQIFLKEVRELAVRSMLLLCVQFTPVLLVLWAAYNDDEPHKQVLTFLIPVVLLFGGTVAAIVLGCLQSVFEVRRDQWAFLMHRGISATQIYLGKIAAGGLMFGTITLIPACFAFAFSLRGGTERYPFAWSLAVPMLTAILAAAGFYFATILAVVWKGPWKFSRLLPATCPIGAVFLTVGLFQITEYVPFRYLLLLVLTSTVLAVAGWSVFVSSGEAVGRPARGTVALGFAVFPALMLILPLLLLISQLAFVEYYRRHSASARARGDESQPFTNYLINRQGHVCQVDAKGNADKSTVTRFVDLKEPDSLKYAKLLGRDLSDFYKQKDIPDWDPLPIARVWNSSSLWNFAGINEGERVLQEVSRYGHGTTYLWVYSRADGLVYGYTQERALDRYGRSYRKPPQLIAAFGPDGFKELSEKPRRRFGRFLGIGINLWDAEFMGSGLSNPGRSGPQGWSPFYLLFEGGLYFVHIDKRLVHPVLTAPEGKKIQQVVPMRSKMAMVYEDSVSVHELTVKNPGANDFPVVEFKLTGEFEYSFPIPRVLKDEDYFEFGRIPGKDEIVFKGFSRLAKRHLVFSTTLDGKILERELYGEPVSLPPFAIITLAESALFLPPAPAALTVAADFANQSIQRTGQGGDLRFWLLSPVEMFLITLLHLGTAALCWFLAGRTARRYGFDSCTRRIWQNLALLFGVPGLLTLWFLRDWPAREVCAKCGKKRPVDNAHCLYCGERAPVPAKTGTEILVDLQAPAPQAA